MAVMMTETDLLRDLEAAQTRSREAMDHLVAAGVNVAAFMVSGWPGIDRVAEVVRLHEIYRLEPSAIVLVLGPRED